MLLYVALDTDLLHSIQRRVLCLIDQGRYFDLKDLQDDPARFQQAVPEITDFLIEQHIHPGSVKQIFLMKVDAASTASAHCDVSDRLNRCLSLNIPIRVHEQSRMNWYRQGTVQHYRQHPYYGKYAVFLDPQQRDLMDSLYLDRPYLCRVDVLHNIYNPAPEDRLIVSLAFDPEPLALWPEVLRANDLSELVPGQTIHFDQAY
jgi:hypothetical protein